MMTWWALTGSNRRPSRCKREEKPKSAGITSSVFGTERDDMANKAELADHALTTARLQVAAMIARLHARWSTLPLPVRWLLGAFVVLFVVGPLTSLVAWIMWRAGR